MKWSDGEPATAQDALWTYQLVLDAVASEAGYVGSGYLEPYLTNAGITAVTAPDDLTLVVTTELPTTLLTQAYVPILPKHVWEKYSLDQIGNAEADGFFVNEPPVVGTGPVRGRRVGPGEFIRFVRTRTTGASRALPEEVSSRLRRHGHDGRGPQERRHRLRPGRRRRPVRRAQAEPDIKTVEGFANGYTYLSFNTDGNRRGLRRAHVRAPDRRSVTRSATPSTRGARRGHARRPRARRRYHHPAVPQALARPAGQPRGRSTSPRPTGD